MYWEVLAAASRAYIAEEKVGKENLGGTSNSLKFFFPAFSSPIYALLAAASTSQYIYSY